MAGFGGAVKLTGESEYRKALKEINQSLKETSSEMKAVSSAFSASDKSESSVTAKTEVLNKKLQEQTQKLTVLKAQYATMSAQYSTQTSKHEALVNEYNKEKQKLDEIGRTLGTTSSEYQQQKAKVDGLAQEVRKSTQAQDANEKSMSQMRIQINNAQADCNATAKALDDLGTEAEESGKDAEKASDGFTVFKGVLADLSSRAIASAINGLKKLGGAVISVGKDALDSYAEYEQLVGGVETMFKKSAPQVQKYADEAFMTAGLSANEYMDTVTSFSASLIQSLNGDTKKAGEVANRAIMDMSDNANKMGTDMGSIQNAYQGFAKQNYTMLDNLKLGYGGTKTEMERLIKDASQMTDIQKELGVTVDASDMSFANIANAISVVQKNMGIMGTTAKEAEDTIQGSTKMMQASWQNLLTGMADDNANFKQLTDNFVKSLMTMLDNIIPRVQIIISGMAEVAGQLLNKVVPKLVKMIPPLLSQTLPILFNAVRSILQSIIDILPEIIPIITDLIPKIVNSLVAVMPQLVEAGVQIMLALIQGLNEAIPQLMDMLPHIINTLVNVILQNLPLFIEAGLQLMVSLIEGLSEAIPQLVEYIPTIITTITQVILDNLPLIVNSAIQIIKAVIKGLALSLNQLLIPAKKIVDTTATAIGNALAEMIDAGIKMVKSVVSGIGQKIKDVADKAKEVGKAFLNALKEFPSQMLSVGKDLVAGIWQGISGSLGWIKDRIRGWVGDVTSFLKKLFKIGSPSKLFADEIGKNLALGIGIGFTDEMKNVANIMGDSIPTSFDINSSQRRTGYQSMVDTEMINAFKEALKQVNIVLDDEKAGEFIDKTVTNLIYT